MRKLCMALVTAGLTISPTAWAAGPLEPGKPAGVSKAQMDNETVTIAVGVLAAAAVIAAAAGGGNGLGAATPATTPTVTTTTTT